MEDLEQMPSSDPLLPAEVAHLFRVDPKTVTRWAKAGKLASFKTIGRHRRFRAGVVLAKLREDGRSMNPFPQKIRKQRRRLAITAAAVGCFALALLTVACGSAVAIWFGG